MEEDQENSVERLKSALWFAVGKIVDEASLERNLNASPQFIGALAEMVWMQIESVATDIESFAQHAGRTTVKTEDVLLLSRNNHDLHALLKDYIDKKEAKKQTKKPAKSK